MLTHLILYWCFIVLQL